MPASVSSINRGTAKSKSREERQADLAKQRAQFKAFAAEATSEGQVRVARERGRQRVRVEKARRVNRIAERQASEQARQETTAKRVQLRQQTDQQRAVQKLQTEQDLAGVKRQERFKNDVLFGTTGQIASTTAPARNTVFMLFGLFFTMIIFYVIVTNGQAFGGLLSTAGTFIHGFSSTNPLFVSTQSQG